MKILLIFGENLFHYQRQILKELSYLNKVEIFGASTNYKSKVPKDSKLLRMINSKFPVFKTDPYSFEKTDRFMESSIEIKAYREDLFYEYVLNFCEATVIENFKIKCAQVLKIAIDIKKWYAQSINESPYTTIHLLSSADNKVFIPLKSLSFSTEIGMYNNRDKALYYYSYLIKSVFNEKNYEVQESNQNGYHFVKSWNYHLKLLKIIVQRKFSKVQLNWKLAVLENNKPTIITEEAGAFWADPFIINDSRNNWIFFEELDHKTRLGKISVINLQDGKPLKKEVVLEKPYHLSFPNVFKFEKDYYMMPEESASNEQNIYKATRFPFQWEKYKTIFKNIKMVDSVFIFHDGRYWLFFNKIEDFEYENNERVYVYSSTDLFSDDWESHPQNPVVIDKTRARNAGKIRKEEGHFIRVSQNCKVTYGENVYKNKITHLSLEKYTEEKQVYNPKFNSYYGFHTLNSAGNLSVIDLLMKESTSTQIIAKD